MMEILLSVIVQAAPIYIAALGGLTSELSGRLNIGLEGGILFGAFFSSVFMVMLGPDIGFIAISLTALLTGTAFGALSGLIIAWLSVRRGANVFIVGLGMNLLAWGLIPLLSQVLLGSKGVIPLELSARVQDGSGWLAVILAIISMVLLTAYLTRHNSGLRLRKIYLDEYTARVQGTKVSRFQFNSLIFSSGLSGMAGALIALHLGSYVPNLSAGKGWIALVVIYLGNRKPGGILVGTIFFAGAQLLAAESQRFISAPGLLIGLPFLLTLLSLIVYRGIAVYISNRREGDSYRQEE